VADLRAPTPTAAAEKAVPVLGELLLELGDLGARLPAAAFRLIERGRERTAGLARGLPRPQSLIDAATQRLDDRAERLDAGIDRVLERRAARVRELAARLKSPGQRFAEAAGRLDLTGQRLEAVMGRVLDRAAARLDRVAAGLSPAAAIRAGRLGRERLDGLGVRLDAGAGLKLQRLGERLEAQAALLESYSYRRALARGFALVETVDAVGGIGQPVTRAAVVSPGQALALVFADGRVDVQVSGEAGTTPPAAPRRRGRGRGPAAQPDLF
jgi:exodeoxyribonuclease VII large subunit